MPGNSRRLSLEAEKEREVPDVSLESRSQLGPFLKFVNRERSIKVLLRHAADQYNKYLKGFGEKEAQFAACSGGPGLGKVRMKIIALCLYLTFFVVDNFLSQSLQSCSGWERRRQGHHVGGSG